MNESIEFCRVCNGFMPSINFNREHYPKYKSNIFCKHCLTGDDSVNVIKYLRIIAGRKLVENWLTEDQLDNLGYSLLEVVSSPLKHFNVIENILNGYAEENRIVFCKQDRNLAYTFWGEKKPVTQDLSLLTDKQENQILEHAGNELLHNKILKLTEEVGELSQAYLRNKKTVNSSKSLNISDEAVLEEAIDTLLVVKDIINSFPQFSLDEKKEIITRKIKKWFNKQGSLNILEQE